MTNVIETRRCVARGDSISPRAMSRVWVSFCVLILVACGDAGSSKPAPRAPAAVAPAAPFRALELVPADTPYFVATVDPIQDAELDRYDDWMRTLADLAPPDPRNIELWRDYVDLLRGGLAQAMERVGLGRNMRFVLYGQSYFPVLRLEVADSARLVEALTGWLRRTKSRFDTTPVAGLQTIAFRAEHMDLVIAFPSKTEVVATLVVPGETQEMVEEILTGRPPKTPLAGSARLHALESSGAPAHLVASFDFVGLFEELGMTGDSGDPCEDEMYTLAAVVPSLDVTSGWRDGWVDTRIHAALAPTIASWLAGLRVPVPGLELPPRGEPLLVAGAGVDVRAFDEGIARAAYVITRYPFRCEPLRALNRLAADVHGGLLRQLPPVIAGLRGGVVRVDKLEKGAASGAIGHALVLHEHPEEVVAVIDGYRPKAPGLGDVVVRSGEGRVAFGMGEDDAAVSKLLREETAAEGPIAVVAIDMKRWTAFVASAAPVAITREARAMIELYGGQGFVAYGLYADPSGATLRILTKR
jgi:hypothetical protein